MDCGVTCLRILVKYYGQIASIYKIRKLCKTTKNGINLLGISDAAEKLGVRTYGVRLSLDQLQEAKLPCILHWNQNHFTVLDKIKKGKYFISDAAMGLISYDEKEFAKNWFSTKKLYSGQSHILSPTPHFYQIDEDEPESTLKWSKIFIYFYKYKRLFI